MKVQIEVLDDESLDKFAERVGRSVEQVREDNQQLDEALEDLQRKDAVAADLKSNGFGELEVAVQEVEVLKGETLQKFEERVRPCSRNQLLLFNSELDEMFKPGNAFAQRVQERVQKEPFNHFSKLRVQAHIVVAERPLPDAPEPLANLENRNRLWLTYESLFNQRPYRKINQACAMGLYRIPVKNLRIFLRESVDRELVETLVAAFFPDLTVDWIEGLSADEWKWKVRRPVLGQQSPQKLVANRHQNVLYLSRFAVLPYNFIDNTESSGAIGTKATTTWGSKLVQLEPTWRFWKTASRSCIVELARVKKAGAPWQPINRKGQFKWSYPDNQDVSDEDVGRNERGVDLAGEANKDQAFDHAAVANAFSVKTGVVWVGIRNQQGAHKDKLEENCIVACLRSDLIVERDRAANRDPKTDPDLIVQTELLSMTERNPDDNESFGDGVQVRDLSLLDPSKLYIPPISIPFLDRNMNKLVRRFSCCGNEEWRNFWCDSYARAIGRAKALLLLRYGLQMGSPNAQNWLLEFEPGDQPRFTGRVVVRDVGDAYLHREVIWARYGGNGLPPQERDDRTRLAELKSKIIKYECKELAAKWDYYPQETGSIYEQQYGPPGTRFLWHRFSTLSKGSSVAVPSQLGTDPDAYSNGWQGVLATMAHWGIAHAQAYVDCIQTALSVNLGIDWRGAPKPERYLQLANDDQQRADAYYKEDRDWEDGKDDGVSVTVHRYLASQEGQQAIKRLG